MNEYKVRLIKSLCQDGFHGKDRKLATRKARRHLTRITNKDVAEYKNAA